MKFFLKLNQFESIAIVRKLSIIGFLVFLNICMVPQSFAQELHPIIVERVKCGKNASNTQDSIKCARAAYTAWDKELNEVYTKLMNSIASKEIKEKLSNSELAWLAFRDKEFKFIEARLKNAEGTIWPIVAQNLKNDILKKRVEELYDNLYAMNMAEKVPYIFCTKEN